jgi:hypothetical protein
MKTLSLNQMEGIVAGDGNWGDWVCGGVGAGAAVAVVLKVAIGPIGTAVSVGCGIYGLGRVADWW